MCVRAAGTEEGEEVGKFLVPGICGVSVHTAHLLTLLLFRLHTVKEMRKPFETGIFFCSTSPYKQRRMEFRSSADSMRSNVVV